jgi:hypothetical protein
MLEMFAVDEAWAHDKANLNGACVAFDPASKAAIALARKWREGALDKDCIAPEGADRSNHRHDQALLTVLAHLDGMAQITEHRLLGFLIHQDVEARQAAALTKLRRLVFPRGTPALVKRIFFYMG